MKKNCNCSCNSDELYYNDLGNIDRVIENILNELNNFKVYSDEAEIIVNSEKERVLAETKRIKAETERIQNEIERIKQEEKRQGNNKEFTENENQRLEKFKEIEDKIAEIEKSETERKTKYNEWDNKLNTFNDLSNTLNTKIKEINKTIEKINNLETTTTEDKDKLYTLIDKVDKNITDIENTTKEITTIKNANNKAIQDLKSSIEDIKKNITSNEKLTSIENDLKSLKENKTSVDSSIKSINTKLDDYNKRIAENKENVTNTENSLALAQEKIKNIENSVNKILDGSSSETNVDVTQFNLLKSKVENNEKGLTANNETLSTLKTKISTTSDKITQLEKDLKDKETNLENKISTTNSSIISLDEKVNSNQKSLNDKANKVDLNNKADKKHTHNISDITDLETTLSNKANTSDLENKADKIDLKTKADKTHKHNISDITNLQAELDKKSNLVELGSVNLIKNSDDLNSWVKYDGGNHTITKEFMNEFKIDGQRIKSDTGNSTDFIKSYINLDVENLIVGKTYTFSIYVKNNRDVKAQIRVQGFDWNFAYELQASECKRFFVSGKRGHITGQLTKIVQFQLRSADKTQYVDMTVSRPQLEEGNTVTSWSKNPNDYKDDINKLKTTLDDKADKSDTLTKYDLVTETDKLKNSLDKKADKSDIISKDELNNLNIKIDNFKRSVLWEYNYSKSTFSAGSFGFNYDNYIDLDKKYGDTIFTTSNSNSNITIDKSKVSNFDKSSERLLVINDDDGKYRIVQDILQAEGKMLYRGKVEDELSDSFYVSKLEQLSRLY